MLLWSIGALLQLAGAAPMDAPALRVARAAQVRFELVRRAHLPREHGGGSAPCDAVIGRFCYWYDSTESDAVPEPPRIPAARASLLAVLDSVGRRVPADGWVTGQRVRYLIEGAQPGEAIRVARECRAERWWCDALEGLALHTATRYVEADSAFARALAAMPVAQRCDWTDLRDYVTRGISKELAGTTCEERSAIAERLWTLGQPLWSVPGSDLRTEHFARHTLALILSRSENAHGVSWSDDTRELLLRYGWAEWFTRREVSSYRLERGGILGHGREPSYFFFPDVRSARGMPRVDAGSWRLRDPLAPTRYAPRHVEWLGDLSHQLARFPRGDAMLIAARFRATDTALARDSIAAAFVVLRGTERLVDRTMPGEPVFAMLRRDTSVLSLELLGSTTRRAERARYTVEPLPCARWCLSDILLFAPRDSTGDVGLEQAARTAIVAPSLSNREPLGVYWEVEANDDRARGESRLDDALVWASVTVEPVRVSAARRVAARIRLAALPAAVRLRWRMKLAPFGSVVLRMPESAVGRYRVRLTIEAPDAAPLTSVREIVLGR